MVGTEYQMCARKVVSFYQRLLHNTGTTVVIYLAIDRGRVTNNKVRSSMRYHIKDHKLTY